MSVQKQRQQQTARYLRLGHTEQAIKRHFKKQDLIALLTETEVSILTASVFMQLIEEVYGRDLPPLELSTKKDTERFLALVEEGRSQ